ncbi:MAG: HesA/MoeB/ThiF family protein [Nitrospiria bacterium]
MKKPLPDSNKDPFQRNIGLINEDQQSRLLNSKVLICGVGGMGGVCAEVLVRLGIGHLILADHDFFELSNFNRQIHSNIESVGRNKAEVLAEEFIKINPNLQVKANSKGITQENVEELLTFVDVVVNGMDKMKSSLILERRARALGKPIVDAWLTPYASVFVSQGNSVHWEEYLQLPTSGVSLENLSPKLCQEAVAKEVSYTFSHGDPYKYVDRETIKKVVEDRIPRPSLAPVVWLSGVLMANEAFKLIVGLPTTNHIGIIYDQYEHRILLREKPNERKT